jgi:hypothetical protein
MRKWERTLTYFKRLSHKYDGQDNKEEELELRPRQPGKWLFRTYCQAKEQDIMRVKLKSKVRKTITLFTAPLGTKGSTEFTVEHSIQANPKTITN